MLHYDNLPDTVELTHLLDIAAGLRELTSDPRCVADVPLFLAQSFGLDGVIVGIVRGRDGDEGQILSVYSSAAGPLGTADEQQRLQRSLLELSRVPSSTAERHEPAGRLADSAGQVLTTEPRQIVLTRRLNDTHRLIVLLQQRAGSAAIHPQTLECAHLVVSHLAHSLAVMLQWQSYPHGLGEPFDRLTEREWVVLCELNSEDGEKQLADRLHLSPHTLHSHIKAIYRKVGVQGRLPLLQKFHQALRAYRLRQSAGPLSPTTRGRAAG